MLNIYADESCLTHRYLVIGGISVEESDLKLATLRFMDIRHKHNTWAEAKWAKVSNKKLSFYQDYMKVFFELNSKDILHFHALYIDTHTFAKGHDPEVSFSKLVYQLLLHKFGRKYGDAHRLYAYLDERKTSENPEFMIPMLNADLHKRGIKTKPYKRIHYVKSHDHELIQVNDLIIGAVGSRKNGHHLVAGANVAKVTLGNEISAAAKTTAPYAWMITTRFAPRFSIWNFKYNK